MEITTPTLSVLFEQLGLPHSEAEIAQFITDHRPLPDSVLLTDAPFWTPAQAQFLKESLKQDADWAPVVDDLNALLHR